MSKIVDDIRDEVNATCTEDERIVAESLDAAVVLLMAAGIEKQAIARVFFSFGCGVAAGAGYTAEQARAHVDRCWPKLEAAKAALAAEAKANAS